MKPKKTDVLLGFCIVLVAQQPYYKKGLLIFAVSGHVWKSLDFSQGEACEARKARLETVFGKIMERSWKACGQAWQVSEWVLQRLVLETS